MYAATFIGLLSAILTVRSCGGVDVQISAPTTSLFPGVMTGEWRVLRTPDYPAGDVLGVSLTVAGDQYAAIGFSPEGMAGPIVACYVDDAARAVCRNLIGTIGGGLSHVTPPQTASVVKAYIEDGFRTVEFVVPTAALNVTMNAQEEVRLIFAHGRWNATDGMPLYHGPHNHTALTSSLFRPIASPAFDVLPGSMNVQWRVLRNSAAAGGDSLAVTLKVISFSGDAFAGIGFSTIGMSGPIVACTVPNASAPLCKNFIGNVGGGLDEALPPQTVRILWASVREDGERNVEFEVPFSALNLSSPESTYARVIFAHGRWDPSAGRPTYHGPNRTILHFNLYTGELAPRDAVLTTWSAPIQFVPGAQVSWRLHLNGSGVSNSFLELYVKLNSVGRHFVVLGWLTHEDLGVAVAAKYTPNNPLSVTDLTVTGPIGAQLGFQPASSQQSTPAFAMDVDGETTIILHSPLSRAPFENAAVSAFFALAEITDASFPTASNSTAYFYCNFFQNTFSLPRTPVLELFDGVMTAQWRLVEFASQHQSAAAAEITLALVSSDEGPETNFVAIGHWRDGVAGPFVACCLSRISACDVLCRDFVSDAKGAVALGSKQLTQGMGSSSEDSVATVTFAVPLRALNLTLAQAQGAVRLVFAFGLWNNSIGGPNFDNASRVVREVVFATGEQSR